MCFIAMACCLRYHPQRTMATAACAAAMRADMVAPVAATGLAEALRKIKSRKNATTVILGEATKFTVAGTLCEESSIHRQPSLALSTTMRDEEDASVTVKLLISNFVLASSAKNETDSRMWFPKGAKVNIVDPRVVQFGTRLGFVVDNPASVEFKGVEHLPADAGTWGSTDAERCFWSAGIAFSNGDFLRAALLYRDCVALGFHLAFEAYSRSCLAWFKLGCFEKAYLDAGKAVEVKPRDLGSLMVKGEALVALQEYRLALECFGQAAETINEDETPDFDINRLRDAQKRCSNLHKQSLTGKYDISNYLRNKKSESSAPECSDYVGSIKMEMVDGMGRGLFATKDFSTGELILVSNSIARGPPGLEFHATIGRLCMSNRRIISQLSAFFDDKLLPNLDLFRPNVNWFQRNTDRLKPCSSYGYLFTEMGKRNGLCPLATMVNHSCVPNVSRQAVGNALFVRAAREITSGEELTACYFDPFFPREVRHAQAKDRNFTFVCSCCRCKVEEMLESQSSEIRQKYDLAMRGSDAKALKELAEVSDELDLLLEMNKLDERSKQWLRCSYMYAYWSRAYFSEGKTRLQREDTLKLLLAAMHETVPGYIFTLAKMVELAGGENGIKVAGVRKILEDEVMSCFGKQSPEVVMSVVLSAGPPKDGLLF